MIKLQLQRVQFTFCNRNPQAAVLVAYNRVNLSTNGGIESLGSDRPHRISFLFQFQDIAVLLMFLFLSPLDCHLMDYSPTSTIPGQPYQMPSELSYQQLQDLIQLVNEADTEDFFELAKIAGLNPINDFSGADLREVDLRSAQLAKANFINTDLSGAVLINANLDEARLIGAQLVSAVLTGATLTHADLVSANLTRANLLSTNFHNANLKRANLSQANLSNADLCRADLTAATLTGANLGEADLMHANLRRADLTGTDLSGASFYGSDLSNCDLRWADLSAINLTGATVVQALFGNNLGLSKEMYLDLRQRGAYFVVPGTES